MSIRSLALAAALFVSAPALGQAPPAPEFAPGAKGAVTVYRHVSLVDPLAGAVRRDMAVVVEGERIRAVTADGDAAVPEGARSVDLKGAFMLPGLIDSHVHLATPPNRRWAEAQMRRDLYGGITAVRDMADDLRAVAEYSRQALVGEIAAPDIYYAALVAGPSFFRDPRTRAATGGLEPGRVPWMQSIDEGTDIRLAVAMARGTGATGLKIYANLPGSLVAKLAAEAHRQGFPVWAHGMVFPATPAEVVGAGADVVSHVCYLAYQAMAKRPQSYQDRFPIDAGLFAKGDNAAMAALFAEMKRRGTILDATDRVYVEAAKAAAKAGKPYHCTPELAARLTNQAWRAGVTLSAGTDGNSARSDPFPALYEELVLLEEKAGLPAAAVLRAATLGGAATIGRQREMGSIEVGKLANLVVTAKNPLESVRNVATIILTVKRGREFARSAFRPIDEAEMPDDD
ncbi:MAG: hydrolase [Alphaproteobacteria bacterium]|nr:MAG: hydrolase [Alphaproteobacteria bacterium]